MSGSGNHNDSCAHAVGHACRCTGCGGALHGWRGWVAVASDTDSTRQGRRQTVDSQWREHYKPPRKRSNKKSRAASTDAARLDIAEWLADQEGNVPPPRRTGGIPQEGERLPTSPPSNSPDAEAPTQSDDQSVATTLPGSAPEKPSDVSPRLNGADVEPEDHSGPPVPQPDQFASAKSPGKPPVPARYPAATDQVEIFAYELTESVWDDVAAELGADTEAVKEVKRQLAHHGWCDLFVGLVQAIDACGELLDTTIPEWIKHQVKESILDSSMRDERPDVTSAVVDIVVDRVWSAFKAATIDNIHIISVITHEDTLRSLRILAVFICPAPEDHKEVREHALKPLGDDARAILTAQTKARLGALFDEWMTDA